MMKIMKCFKGEINYTLLTVFIPQHFRGCFCGRGGVWGVETHYFKTCVAQAKTDFESHLKCVILA